MKKLLLVAMGILLLAGCGKADSDAGFQELEQRANKVEQQDTREEKQDEDEAVDAEEEDNEDEVGGEAVSESVTETETESDTDAADQAEKDAENSGSTFRWSDVSDQEFWFASGAGGWSTDMTIKADGSFEGNYHDSDMGDTGKGYPNGTLYYCDFSGRFSKPEQVDEYTWKFEMEDLNYAPYDKPEEIIDEVLYIYTGAYGLEGGSTFYMYLPGTPLDTLPEEFLSWVGYYDLNDTSDTVLPFYGLYNVAEQEGFSSSEVLSAYDLAKNSLDDARERYDEKDAKLSSAALTQIELNQLSGEQYTEIDSELNYIWSLIKSELPENRYNEILDEQRKWIKDKEAKVAAEGEQWGQGTMRPLAENTLAASLTLDRCYELVEYLQ